MTLACGDKVLQSIVRDRIGASTSSFTCANVATSNSSRSRSEWTYYFLERSRLFLDNSQARESHEIVARKNCLEMAVMLTNVPDNEAFAEKWLKENVQEVKFRLSLAGSGAQARAVMDGLPADVVSLALPLDVLKIQEAGLIDSNWQKRVPNNGVPAESTVCIVTRKGNPKNITDWVDLARPDVSCLTANPKTAGVARWNFLALWGSITVEGGSDEEAQRLIENVFRNVPVEPRDAREVSDVFFKQELGDAMITYENEIFLTNEKIVEGGSEALPYTIPARNVRVEMSISVVDRNARRSGVYEVAEAFVSFCFTEPAQREYAKAGFRPYLQSVAEEFNISPIEKPWKVEDNVGDWLNVQERFFSDKGLINVIEKNVRADRLAQA